MRLLLVGSERDRGRLHHELAAASIDIAGEFDSLAAAQAAGITADGFLLAGANGGGVAAGDDESEFIQERLTPRETQVLELLAEGLPNRAIAQRLDISDQTVKFHVASIAGKLGAANRTDAVRRAVRRGLITL
jgi:DNA-binding NarL/FixJ family response regulator